MNSYAKKYFLIGGAKLLRAPLFMLLISLLSNLIGPAGIGKWSMVIAVSTFFHSILLSWTQAPFVRFGCDEWQETARLSKTWAARYPLILFGFVFALLILIAQPFLFFEKLVLLPSSWWPLVFIYLIALWFLDESQSLFKIKENFKLLSILPLFSDLIIILFLLFLFYVSFNLSILEVIAAIIALFTLFWGTIWAKEISNSRCRGEKSTREGISKIINFGWPMVPTYALGFLSDWGDHFLLQRFHGDQQVGFFHAGYQVSVAMTAFASPFAVIFLPRLLERKKLDENAELDYLNKTVPTVIILWFIAIIPCMAFVPWIFGVIFGQKFLGAQQAFYVLCTTIPGAVFTSLYSVLFNAQGRLGRTGIFISLMVVLNLSISFLLIPKLGSLGAAIGTATSFFLVQGLYVFDQHNFLNTSSSKPIALFFIAWLFSAIQLIMGGQIFFRFLVALIAIGVVTFIAKRWQIFDEERIATLLPRQLLWVWKLF